jgi:hypothetical protein
MRKALKYRMCLTNGKRGMLEQPLEECRSGYRQTLMPRRYSHANGAMCGLYAAQVLLPIWEDVAALGFADL